MQHQKVSSVLLRGGAVLCCRGLQSPQADGMEFAVRLRISINMNAALDKSLPGSKRLSEGIRAIQRKCSVSEAAA